MLTTLPRLLPIFFGPSPPASSTPPFIFRPLEIVSIPLCIQ